MYSNPINLNIFDSISLKELEQVSLLNRKDTKFIFHQSKLPDLLDKIKSSYKILNIEDINQFDYNNTYFDTDNLLFYNQHHNECRKRFKVRLRKYSPTNECYFEIKVKNNKNRTIKNRIKRNTLNDTNYNSILDEEKQLVSDIIGISSDMLSPKLSVQFSRITLVDNSFGERLTIDTGLTLKNDKECISFDWLVISEIKQKKYNVRSDYIRTLRSLKIPEMRFSKYCIGMINIYKDIKYNRFKPKQLYLDKMSIQT